MVRRMFMQQQYRTLHHQQDTFYRWRGTHYAEAAREEVRATVYDFLDGVKQMNDNGKLVSFNPNKAKVANVLEALAASAQLDGSIRPGLTTSGIRRRAISWHAQMVCFTFRRGYYCRLARLSSASMPSIMHMMQRPKTQRHGWNFSHRSGRAIRNRSTPCKSCSGCC